MKQFRNFFVFLFIFCLFEFTCLKSEKILVNKIIARVNGVNILKSDLEKKRISKNGVGYTLQEAILEEILLQKATELKMLPTELDVEKQIVSLKSNNNLNDLTDQEFEEQLEEEGFNLKEYKSQLAKMLATEKLKHAEFSERIVVTNQQVEEYCVSHPEWIDDKYLIKICTLNQDQLTSDNKVKSDVTLKWENLDWINKKDLSKELAFIKDFKVGQVSDLMKTQNGYQMIKLADKKEGHNRTIEERFGEVERLLQEQKREKFEKEFNKELLEKSSIIYLD